MGRIKVVKNIEQLAAEYAEKSGGTLLKGCAKKSYADGARDMLELVSEIVFDNGFKKIPRLQLLITDLEKED
jgi:hypothetical protein